MENRRTQPYKNAGKTAALLLAALALGLSVWACTAKGETGGAGETVSSGAPSTASSAPASVAQQTPAEKYGVTEDVINRYFPEGIPEGLTDEQIQAVLRGEGVKVTLDGVETVFNPEAWYASGQGE